MKKSTERWYFINPRLAPGEPDDSLSNYEKIEYIDQGGFGKVEKYLRKKDSLKVAIKSIFKKNLQPFARKLIESELRNMYKIDHPNVIKLISHFEDEEKICIVTEYCANGNLYSFLAGQGGKLDERLCIFFLRQIVDAIDYLHNLNPPIIHRDIKPENILLSDNHVIKLIDFGSSKAFEQSKSMQTHTGTPIYMPPEIISEVQQSEKVDMWSLGILIYEFLTGETPFDDKNDVDNPHRLKLIQEKILRNEINFPSTFPPLAKGLVLSLLSRDPLKRPDMKKIKEDPWLKQFPEDEDELQLRTSFRLKQTIGFKNAESISALFNLKIREKSSVGLDRENRDKLDEMREEISNLSLEIEDLKAKRMLQKQQTGFLLEYLEQNKDSITNTEKQKYHPRTVENARKEQLKFTEEKNALLKIIAKKELLVLKNELSISNSKEDVDKKLQNEESKLEKAKQQFEENKAIIERLRQKVASLEQQIEGLKKETNVDINQEEQVQAKEEYRRKSIEQTHEFERYQNDLLDEIKKFISADYFNDQEKDLKDKIDLLELKKQNLAHHKLDKQKNEYLKELQEISEQDNSKLIAEKKVFQARIEELKGQYEKELGNYENGLLLKKQYEGCMKEVEIKTAIKDTLQHQKNIILDNHNLKLAL